MALFARLQTDLNSTARLISQLADRSVSNQKRIESLEKAQAATSKLLESAEPAKLKQLFQDVAQLKKSVQKVEAQLDELNEFLASLANEGDSADNNGKPIPNDRRP